MIYKFTDGHLAVGKALEAKAKRVDPAGWVVDRNCEYRVSRALKQ